MHNNIMAAGSRDCPPMLATGRYAQWRSRFLRYIDTRPKENSSEVPEGTAVETVSTMSPENKDHYESEKEAIHLILTGIGDEIYSTVDACKTAHEMWEAIERLQQGESLNIQDVKTNLFWEFGKFTSHDGETIESYYTRFYKLMNEMIRNNLTVDKMQVNVQFLQQLQPEWSRFVTIVKQQHKLDEVSYHKFFDILKQYQKEVNELRAERIAKNANPLALVATAQPHQDPYYQTSKSHKSYAPTSKASLPTRSHATTRHKGKEIAKPITPPSESPSDEDSDPEQAQKDKEMQKNLALIAKYFKKLYKPTNNNLRTSSNTRNKNVDTTPRKPKRVKDSTYHKENMLLCKQAEKVETGDSNVILDSQDMCDNHIQNDQNVVEYDDERVALANLIANLKLDVDENKKIQKQLKKANASLTQELTECKFILTKTSRTLGESNSIRDSCLVALQNKQTELERYKAFNDRTVDYDKLERKLNETLGLLAQKDIDIKEGLKVKAYEISVVKEKHDELVKQSLLTKLHYEGLVKEKTKNSSYLGLRKKCRLSLKNDIPSRDNFLIFGQTALLSSVNLLADSNVIPDSPDMCDNDIQNDQNVVECDDERVALANLIANLKLDVDENKKIQKQLKKANASLTQELTECKSILTETSGTPRESNSIRDSCLVALQNKQTEFERYKAFNDRTVDYDKLEHKLNKTLGLLAQKEIDIKEGLKVKAYEILVVKEKHDELVKQSLLIKSHYEGLVKEKTKVITDLKLKEEKYIDKMISMENQLKFLNEIVYKRSQSIQTIHMLAPKCPTFNGRPAFANPMYLKKAQYEKPCLYEIPHDQFDLANRLVLDREEILTLEEES
ncbi:hypothetical protein Tco_1055349 [Tanacetum coccineum]|uniref:Gag-Pol polyprotein n=1 Tax=Tanacetum coccineum TaxID=301880 RepID=A0ABQ5H1F3_9ASTR